MCPVDSPKMGKYSAIVLLVVLIGILHVNATPLDDTQQPATALHTVPGEVNATAAPVSSEEEVPVRKPPAVRYNNTEGSSDDELKRIEEFQDKNMRILRRENETHEEMLRLVEERKHLRASCFHVDEEFCDLNNFTSSDHSERKSNCPCKPHPHIQHAIICCNVTNFQVMPKCYKQAYGMNPGTVYQIHIRNATARELNLSSGWWKHFDRISVTDGAIHRVRGSLAPVTGLSCVNVSNNNISEIDPKAFRAVDVATFAVLDLSQNNLTQIPNLQQFPNVTVNIRENHYMRCKVAQEAVFAGVNFAERNQSKCGSQHEFHWFNSTDLTPISQLYLDKELQKVCPQPCHCRLSRGKYATEEEDSPIYHTVELDCSNSGLTELPLWLPPNTAHLNVSNNNLTNLRGLNRYDNLRRLYADDNQISSMSDLEGTEFKEEFEVLSLRRNKLKLIPIYLLSNTLDKSPRGKALYFGGNKLNCDCNSATELKLWLLGHKNSVLDYDDIQCENMPGFVTQLQDQSLCQSKHDAMDYIFYVIAAEVLLLLALILKVSYDYYIFKTQSYLPWPANKMPKLPCDWLCES